MLRVEAPAGALPSGKWIAFPAPLTSAAVAVLEDAVEQGYEAAYRMTLHSRRADTGLARRLIPALAEVASRGRLAALEGCLRTTIEQMSQPGWYADERLLLPAGEALRTAVQSLVECELGAGTAFLRRRLLALQLGRGLAGCADTGGADDTLLVQQARPATFLTAPLRDAAAVAAWRSIAAAAPRGGRERRRLRLRQLCACRPHSTACASSNIKAGVRVWFDSGIDTGARMGRRARTPNPRSRGDRCLHHQRLRGESLLQRANSQNLPNLIGKPIRANRSEIPGVGGRGCS